MVVEDQVELDRMPKLEEREPMFDFEGVPIAVTRYELRKAKVDIEIGGGQVLKPDQTVRVVGDVVLSHYRIDRERKDAGLTLVQVLSAAEPLEGSA